MINLENLPIKQNIKLRLKNFRPKKIIWELEVDARTVQGFSDQILGATTIESFNRGFSNKIYLIKTGNSLLLVLTLTL